MGGNDGRERRERTTGENDGLYVSLHWVLGVDDHHSTTMGVHIRVHTYISISVTSVATCHSRVTRGCRLGEYQPARRHTRPSSLPSSLPSSPPPSYYLPSNLPSPLLPSLLLSPLVSRLVLRTLIYNNSYFYVSTTTCLLLRVHH